VLDKEKGLRTNNVLSHVAVFDIESYDRLFFITDAAMNVKLIRLAVGITAEIDATGVLTTEGLTWTNGLDATNGGGNFKGILEALETAIPDGGFIMFTGNAAPEAGRKFMVTNFFYSGYTGGAVSVEQFDATVSTLSIELVEDFTEVIAVPAKITTPTISIDRHVLSWVAVPNAASYEIYVDGVLTVTQTTTSLAMSTLDLALTADGSDGYAITVKALTKDMFQWSTSELSVAVLYKQIVIQDLAAPVLAADGTTVTWDLVDGADSYDVYINFAGKDVLVGNTDLGTYDLSSYNDVYAGLTNVYVKAIGDNDHYDSLNSVSVEIFLGEIKSFTIGTHTVEVIETTAYNYFTRRNTDYKLNQTGYANAPYLFLITDINNIKNTDFGATATEAFGTIVLLDSEGKPKLINNIFAKQTWKAGEGWITDDLYAVNSAQLSNITASLAEGDMLLIGKNGSTLNLVNADETTGTVAARDFVAYHYINPWATFPTTPATGGWRDFANFIDPSAVTFELSTIVVETIQAIVIGDSYTEYVYNDTTALEFTSSGTSFRSNPLVQLMTKEFFIAEFNEHKVEHTNNGSVPYFPNGVIVITDANMNVKLIRLAVGITVEVNAEGVLTSTGLTWTNGVDATNGGGNFKGIVEALESAIPDGGFIMFAGNAAPETGRKFLTQNFFYSGYVSGAVTLNQYDANISALTIEIVEEYTK